MRRVVLCSSFEPLVFHEGDQRFRWREKAKASTRQSAPRKQCLRHTPRHPPLPSAPQKGSPPSVNFWLDPPFSTSPFGGPPTATTFQPLRKRGGGEKGRPSNGAWITGMYCGGRGGKEGERAEGIKMFLERVAMGARAIFPWRLFLWRKGKKTEKPPPSPHTHLDAAKLGRGGGKEKGAERYIRRIGA